MSLNGQEVLRTEGQCILFGSVCHFECVVSTRVSFPK